MEFTNLRPKTEFFPKLSAGEGLEGYIFLQGS